MFCLTYAISKLTSKLQSVGDVWNRNLEMFKAKLYRDQRETERTSANHRYELQPGDFSRLYRQHHEAEFGIDVSVAPEYNVDNWLNPASKAYKADLARSVFYYARRAEKNEHFKVCIATPEMRDAAWKYCHQKQLILDGTFGVCSSRLLLWIAMGVDESRSGVPVAMFLFSAPTGTKATHAGYNTQILTELLGAWQKWMDSDRPADASSFKPYAAMTDTDMKERGALLNIWPTILLLLCKFHLRQCWTNKRNSVLSYKASNSPESYAKTYVENRLKNLEQA